MIIMYILHANIDALILAKSFSLKILVLKPKQQKLNVFSSSIEFEKILE
jgi:hypothetical protein